MIRSLACGARFDWDDANIRHIARHKVLKEEVQEAFLDEFALQGPTAWRHNELRYEMTGETNAGRILAVIFIIRKGIIRTVTSYSAEPKAIREYWEKRDHGH
jgi:uncharacterized DUF497 family protein